MRRDGCAVGKEFVGVGEIHGFPLRLGIECANWHVKEQRNNRKALQEMTNGIFELFSEGKSLPNSTAFSGANNPPRSPPSAP